MTNRHLTQDLEERAAFLASCDDDERADAEETFRLVDEAAAFRDLVSDDLEDPEPSMVPGY